MCSSLEKQQNGGELLLTGDIKPDRSFQHHFYSALVQMMGLFLFHQLDLTCDRREHNKKRE